VSRLLAVVFDRAHARFFDIGPSSTIELPCLQSPATRGGRFHSERGDAPGRGERAYHGRLREEERRHLTAIAACIESLARDQSLEVVLAGPDNLTHALRRVLPPPVAARCVGTAHLNPKLVTPAIVEREARRLQAEWIQRLPEAATQIRSTS
jgi:release factor family 10